MATVNLSQNGHRLDRHSRFVSALKARSMFQQRTGVGKAHRWSCTVYVETAGAQFLSAGHSISHSRLAATMHSAVDGGGGDGTHSIRGDSQRQSQTTKRRRRRWFSLGSTTTTMPTSDHACSTPLRFMVSVLQELFLFRDTCRRNMEDFEAMFGPQDWGFGDQESPSYTETVKHMAPSQRRPRSQHTITTAMTTARRPRTQSSQHRHEELGLWRSLYRFLQQHRIHHPLPARIHDDNHAPMARHTPGTPYIEIARTASIINIITVIAASSVATPSPSLPPRYIVRWRRRNRDDGRRRRKS